MSNEITRFNQVTDWGMERDARGEYVLHSEHETEIARLRAEVEGLRSEIDGLRISLALVEMGDDA